jgi:shikimate kinase
MNHTSNIFLVGPMGAGKTSVAKQLSRLTGFPFYDSDHEVQNRTGVSISWIFEVEGEAGFRKREAAVIDELTQMNQIILSTGGGSIITDVNRQHLAERGFVVYLTVDLELQIQRTRRQRGHRPLIDIPDPRERLIELNAVREPLYESIADKVYKTDRKTPKRVAEKIYRDYCARK